MQVVCAILSPFSVDAGRCRSVLLLAELLALRSPNQGSPAGSHASLPCRQSYLVATRTASPNSTKATSVRRSPGSPGADRSARPDRSKTSPTGLVAGDHCRSTSRFRPARLHSIDVSSWPTRSGLPGVEAPSSASDAGAARPIMQLRLVAGGRLPDLPTKTSVVVRRIG
jgi:hypothetical protein